jgi:spore coat protein CotH
MSLRFKRYYPLLIIFAAVLVFLSVFAGRTRVIAYTTQPAATPTPAGANIDNPVALFDETIVHEIQINMDESDYRQMIRTYQQTGEKDSFHADITIDGVTIQDVGIRLKGHASLMAQVCVERPGGQRPEPAQPSEGQATRPARPEPSQGAAIPSGCKMPGVLDNARAPDEIEQLPLLIRFDKYLSGQTYQGYTSIAIRTGGVSDDAAMLQEPVTNSVYRLMGQPAPLTAYTGLRFNDGQEILYVVAEVIDEAYLARNFGETRDVLYKASLGAEVLTYKGADPSAYATSFSQETHVGESDLAPLIEFIRFINQSDDATFTRDLPRRFDVESFATYLAINTHGQRQLELLINDN